MAIPAIAVPLEKDAYGAYKVAGTRVTLDVLVAAYQQGDTPEQIREGFPTLSLATIYTVIAYYLSNRDEVDAYMRKREADAEQIHRDLAAKRPEMFALRDKLLERTAKRA